MIVLGFVYAQLGSLIKGHSPRQDEIKDIIFFSRTICTGLSLGKSEVAR
jgi:hypothetical protein